MRPSAPAALLSIRWCRRCWSDFKGARIVDVRVPETAASAPAAPDEDVGYADAEPAIDDDL